VHVCHVAAQTCLSLNVLLRKFHHVLPLLPDLLLLQLKTFRFKSRLNYVPRFWVIESKQDKRNKDVCATIVVLSMEGFWDGAKRHRT
jgi:hypothetical protein